MSLKKVAVTALCIFLGLSCSITSAAGIAAGQTRSSELPYRSYTYWEDKGSSSRTGAYGKPMYEVKALVSAGDLKLSEDSILKDAVTDKAGNIYLLDSGVSRIYILDKDCKLKKIFKAPVYNGEALDFSGAGGIFADNGNIYIADTKNERVIVSDEDGRVKRLILLPESGYIPSDLEFQPIKVAVDSRGFTYIAVQGSYYGAMLFSPENEFLGFYGANSVQGNVVSRLKALWKRITYNDKKRSADMISLPYTLTDIVIGPEDFVYTATGKKSENKLQKGQICMFNPGGTDALNASDKNFADEKTAVYNMSEQIQNISELAVDDMGYMHLLDITTGRIYLYDRECNMLSCFGGAVGGGEQMGTFGIPSSIALNGQDVLVTDSKKNSLTVFGITNYGAGVKKAQDLTLNGDYEEAFGYWEDILKQDRNSQQAYKGMAMAFYERGDYDKAMKYSKLGYDRTTYAEAFKIKRNEITERYFILLFSGVIALAAAATAFVYYKKKHLLVLIKNKGLRNALSSVAHPAEAFRLVKEKQEGSAAVSIVLVALFYIVTVMNDTMEGFSFSSFDSEKYNAAYTLLSTVGLVILWTVSNWLVCTLNGGIGKLKEIFTVTAYCLIPVIAARLCNLILSNILIPDEAAFLTVLQTVCILYAAFMLIIGIMRIHDFEFGRFLWTTLLTVAAMMVVLFFIFLLYLLFQQIIGWIRTVYIELRYR